MHADKTGWQEKFDIETGKAIKHVEFCCALYMYQVQQGRHFLHPWTARSWKVPIVAELPEHPGVDIVQGHMCHFRMMSHVDRRGGEMGLAKKPKGFMSSSKFFLEEMGRKCPGDMTTYFLLQVEPPVPRFFRRRFVKQYVEESLDKRSTTRAAQSAQAE